MSQQGKVTTDTGLTSPRKCEIQGDFSGGDHPNQRRVNSFGKSLEVTDVSMKKLFYCPS